MFLYTGLSYNLVRAYSFVYQSVLHKILMSAYRKIYLGLSFFTEIFASNIIIKGCHRTEGSRKAGLRSNTGGRDAAAEML